MNGYEAIIASAFADSDSGGGGISVQSLSVTENGTYTAPSGTAYSPVSVNVGNKPLVPSKDVEFIDYDGTTVYSYTKEEFLALDSMPPNPSHEGLIAQGWNWSFTDAKNYVSIYGEHVIGQMYTTDDGKTRFYVHILEDGPSSTRDIGLQFISSIADNVTIDWGDGNTETAGATSLTLYSHTYENGGDYVITMKVNSGTISLQGESSSSNVLGSSSGNYNRSRLQKVEIGNGVTEIAGYSFHAFYGLKSISMPHGITIIGNNIFTSNHNLRAIVIPDTVGSIGEAICSNINYRLEIISIPRGIIILNKNFIAFTHFLRRIVFPDTLTTIAQQAFAPNSGNITKVNIPSSVTSIGKTNFGSQLSSVKEYHLYPTVPPVLGSDNVFSGISEECVIYVPYSADHSILAAYQSATNWSISASYMREEPQ